MEYKCDVCTLQCSMCSRKCTVGDSGAGTGSGAVCTVQCSVCSVLTVTGTLNQISLTKFLVLVLALKKHISVALISLLFRTFSQRLEDIDSLQCSSGSFPH